MKDFYLCSGLRTVIPGDLLDQLRVLPDLRIARVLSGIVMVQFEGDLAAMETRLAGTAWSAFHVSESRTYRFQ